MFAKQLVVVAAAVALAMTHVHAVEQSSVLRVSFGTKHHATHHKTVHHPAVRHHQKNDVDSEELKIEVKGNPNATTSTTSEDVIVTCLPGWKEVSVEGVEGIYCVDSDACFADKKEGACPEAQDGLPWGSYCDMVKSGVYGCKAYTEDMADENEEDQEDNQEEAGEYEEEEEGEEDDEEEDDEEEEEHHLTKRSKVSGRVEEDPISPTPVPRIPVTSTPEPISPTPVPAPPTEDPNSPTPITARPVAAPTPAPAPAPAGNDGCNGGSPTSVEGVSGVYCVGGTACGNAATNGACPGKQFGLPYGSYCAVMKSGVYGCKPNTSHKMMKLTTSAAKKVAKKSKGLKVHVVEKH